jgi:hypothetical protein
MRGAIGLPEQPGCQDSNRLGISSPAPPDDKRSKCLDIGRPQILGIRQVHQQIGAGLVGDESFTTPEMLPLSDVRANAASGASMTHDRNTTRESRSVLMGSPWLQE